MPSQDPLLSSIFLPSCCRSRPNPAQVLQADSDSTNKEISKPFNSINRFGDIRGVDRLDPGSFESRARRTA
jgi:hypothetical protein